MKILVVTYEFPPLNTIGAQRPYSWAKYWSRIGHTVCVLTAQKQEIDGFLDPTFSFDTIPDVTVKAVPYWPFSQKFSQEPKQSASHLSDQASSSLTVRAKQLLKSLRQQTGMGAVFSVRNFWIGPAVKQGIALHEQYRFDVIVSTYGPPAPHHVAKRLKQQLGLFWVADYRDLWAGTHYQNAQGFFDRLQVAEENRTIASADLITTVSDPLRQSLADRFHKPTFTIENGFDTEEIPQPPIASALDKQAKIKLLYTGKVRTGKQVVRPLFEALAVLRQKQSELADKVEILFYGSDLGEIPQLIEAYQLQTVVKIMGMVPRSQSLVLQTQANGLLFLDWEDTSIDGILTGKLFEYLYSGRPILGIGSHDWLAPGKLLHESGCGLCLGTSVDKIATVLQSLIDGHSLPYHPQPEVLARYTRKAIAQRMLKTIEEFCQNR